MKLNLFFLGLALGLSATLSLAFGDESPIDLSAPVAATATAPAATIYDRILAQGVPKASLDRIVKFVDENRGHEINVSAYTCDKQEPDNLTPCEQKKRTHVTKTLKIEDRDYAAVVDMSLPSLTPRFYLINLKTGEVEKFLTTHGRGSGKGLYPYKFGNHQDSNMTSLGLYQTGDIYTKGAHGRTLRLYGLERSNDRAYDRDIVVHGADYADAKFAKTTNPKTKLPYNRLGLSWGCPALSFKIIKEVIAKLRAGSIIDIYQKDLMDAARSNSEVEIPPPAEPSEKPTEQPPAKPLEETIGTPHNQSSLESLPTEPL